MTEIDASPLDELTNDEFDKDIYLTTEEQLYLELCLEKIKVCDEQRRTLTSNDRIRQLEAQNLKLQAELLARQAEIHAFADPKIIQGLDQVNKTREAVIQEKKKLIEEIKTKHDLKTSDFSFDPESGKIVI